MPTMLTKTQCFEDSVPNTWVSKPLHLIFGGQGGCSLRQLGFPGSYWKVGESGRLVPQAARVTQGGVGEEGGAAST